MPRVFLIVLDSFGVGALPDADQYQDAGSNTLKSVSASHVFCAPNLAALGLFHLDGLEPVLRKKATAAPCGAFGKLAEQSCGKDTITGHRELAGLIAKTPFPTYPDGFPQELISAYERACGHQVICNQAYSGTQVLMDYGQEHIKTGALIVYTSADSVFQIAAHEKYFGLEELYRCCEIARRMLTREYAVGRVIARPFVGEYPDFTRTANRHDYAVPPTKPTMLDHLKKHHFDVIGIGKIHDIFAGCGLTQTIRTQGNEDGIQKTLEILKSDFSGLCFVNLVDFDSKFGHRRDADGYARAISLFDEYIPQMRSALNRDDYLIITADHGCDPNFSGTDHTREYVPVLIDSPKLKRSVDLGVRHSFADVAATILDIFALREPTDGQSFYHCLKQGEQR